MEGIEEVVSVEELHARRTLKKKDGPSESSSLELNQSQDEWLDSILKAKSTKTRPIPRVPQMLHESKDSEKHYEPRVVSLGPYHFGKSNLQIGEKLKRKIAGEFVLQKRDVLEGLYDKVLKMSKEMKLYYEENSIDKYFSDETFARMMVQDGCFVLYYIECVLNDTKQDTKPNTSDLEMKSQDIAFVQQDLFLLENQLPFRVLKVLMDARKEFWKEPSTREVDRFTSFIENHVLGYLRESRKESFWRKNLGRLKLCFSMGKEYIDKLSRKRTTQPKGTSTQPTDTPNQNPDPEHLLHHLQNTLVGTEKKKAQSQTTSQSVSSNTDKKSKYHGTNNRYTFRNVDELLEVGIQFRQSRSNHLTAIKYVPGRFHAYLELPPITVDDSTRAMFLNLIAYEMCSDMLNDSWVASYICFLDSLIDHPADVKVLRSAGVLHNCLGSDEEVSHLFNDIGYDLVPNPKAYDDVKRLIQKHYNEPVKTWMAQFSHEHFRSPWSIFALLGALIALFLSGVQAYFSVWSLPDDCNGLFNAIV